MFLKRASRKTAIHRPSSRAITRPQGRLLPLLAALALALPACNAAVITCEEGSDGLEVPDGEFDGQPSQWSLAPHSTIDDTHTGCGGKSSLRIELDQGIGPAEVTRSAPLIGVQPDEEYDVAFHYRFESCSEATLSVHVGNYEHQVHFNGSNGAWGNTSLSIKAGTEALAIDIRPMREGDAASFTGAEFDNNLMWVDDFTITRK